MPGTKAMPPGRPGHDLSTAALVHEIRAPLSAMEAAAGNLRAQLAALLRALSGLTGVEPLRRIAPLVVAGLSEPPPPLPLGLEMDRRCRAAAEALRASGCGCEPVETARRLVLSGWDRRVDEISSFLRPPDGDALLALLEAAGRMRSGLRSLDLSLERLAALGRSTGPLQAPAGGGSADAVTCARAAVEVLRHRIPEGVRVEIEGPAVLPAAGAPVRIQQVIGNLVGNALQAVPRDGGIIRVICSERDGRVAIRVEDNGPGIPDEVRGRLFTPLTTGRPREGGTGLGLFLSRRMAEEMGGTLDVDPDPARTAFELLLPRAGGTRESRGGAGR